MSYGLGTEIVIEITKVPVDCSDVVLEKLVRAVAHAVSEMFPKARVECEATRINREAVACFIIGEEEQFRQECAKGLHK
jgi:hypothetical protein